MRCSDPASLSVHVRVMIFAETNNSRVRVMTVSDGSVRGWTRNGRDRSGGRLQLAIVPGICHRSVVRGIPFLSQRSSSSRKKSPLQHTCLTGGILHRKLLDARRVNTCIYFAVQMTWGSGSELAGDLLVRRPLCCSSLHAGGLLTRRLLQIGGPVQCLHAGGLLFRRLLQSVNVLAQ